ncbi:MAG: hypothetical protein IKT67_08335 [Lachnospiraceae bacterium]|nr:hypothetical protein [Lachnospiraceae bacterium]
MNSHATSGRVKVTYKKGFFAKETVTVEPEADGTYLLYTGTEYKIEVNGYQTGKYLFTVEQDNWVEAPNGCIQTAVEHTAINAFPLSSRYYLSQDMLFITIADIVGAPFITDIESIEKIMNDLGYDREDYVITPSEVGGVILGDVLLVVGIYSLAGSVITAGSGAEAYAALFGTKYATEGTLGTVVGTVYQIVCKPNIELFENVLNYMEKIDLQDTFKECENKAGRYDIYCSNSRGMGLQNLWGAWETRPYVNKIGSDGTVLITERFERIDKTHTEQLRQKFGWK